MEVSQAEGRSETPTPPTPLKHEVEFINNWLTNPEDTKQIIQIGLDMGLQKDKVIQVIREFISYWTEKSPGARKMRWEKEQSFDPIKRLRTFFKNEVTNFGRGIPEARGRKVEGVTMLRP